MNGPHPAGEQTRNAIFAVPAVAWGIVIERPYYWICRGYYRARGEKNYEWHEPLIATIIEIPDMIRDHEKWKRETGRV